MIYFIIWMIAFPLSSAAEHLMCVKSREITGEPEASDGVKAFAALVGLFIYTLVAIALWRRA